MGCVVFGVLFLCFGKFFGGIWEIAVAFWKKLRWEQVQMEKYEFGLLILLVERWINKFKLRKLFFTC